MKEWTFEEKVARIKEQVHRELNFSDYDSTVCRNTTSCYSHAIGATAAFDRIYRVGAISGRKPIGEEYISVDEVIKLLSLDMETLDLGFELYQNEDLLENQYLIMLLIKSYRDRVNDYHFLRCDNGVWTEKWRGQKPLVIDDISKTQYMSFPWERIGVYKITK